MIVLERPALDEGVHRRLLDKILRSAGIGPDEAWVTAVVKCEPPKGTKPSKKDLDACKAWLWREMKLLGPAVVLAMGAVPTSLLQRPAPAVGESVELSYLPGTRLTAWKSLATLYNGPMEGVYDLVTLLEDLKLENDPKARLA